MTIEDEIKAVIDESIALLCFMIVIKEVVKDECPNVIGVLDCPSVRFDNQGV